MNQALERIHSQFSGTLRERLGELRTMRPNQDEPHQWNIWGRGFGNYAQLNNDNTFRGHNSTGFGGAGGIDWAINDSNILIGASIGLTESNINHNSNFEGDISAQHYAIYSTVAKEKFHLDGIFSYGRADNTTQRSIKFADINRVAQGNYNSDIFSAQLEGGYDFQLGKWELEPWAAMRYSTISANEFNEQGADALNLTVHGQNKNWLLGQLGLNIAREYLNANQSISFVPRIRARLQHNFLNTNSKIDFSLLNTDGTVSAVNNPQNMLTLGAGFVLRSLPKKQNKSKHAIYAQYDAGLGLDNQLNQHSIGIGYRLEWH